MPLYSYRDWGDSWGVIGSARVTSNQTGIGLSATDLTSLTVTVALLSGRRYSFYGSARLEQKTGAGAPQLTADIGGTQVQYAGLLRSTNEQAPLSVSDVFTGSGLTTIKLRAFTSANTCDLLASATAPAVLIVRDEGPV